MGLRSQLHRRRRLAYGAWRRTRDWEFWPTWVMVAPLVPWMVRCGLEAGELTAFTASNPGMPTGGLIGESKWQILEDLRRAAPDHLPAARLLRASDPPADRREAALAFYAAQGGAPVVLKPDVGQRASGVVIARSAAVVARYATDVPVDTIAQAYAPGEEFGLFYLRMPGEDRGTLLSIGHKQVLCVTGDGRRDLERLILDDDRAVCLAALHFERLGPRLAEVPAAGARVPLLELGTHARGSIFVDGENLRTSALEQAVDRISRGVPGFHFGRYDVRATPADLREGRFTILELNGVGADQAHVYDPRYGARDYWRTMRHHWQAAYRIGAANMAQGAEATPLLGIWRALQHYQRDVQPLHAQAGFAGPQPSANSPVRSP
jgi:hypothetical protein